MKNWITLLLFLPFLSYGQKEMATWLFGTSGLDFNCSPVKPIEPAAQFGTQEGCSSISDASGNLLFYSDGYRVFDRNHQIMDNGTDIGLDVECFGSSSQAVLIAKQPSQNNRYYIFTTDCAENKLQNGFCYSIVDMSLNGGNGSVILKKQLLLPKTCEKLCAVRHANGIDTWILTHEWGNAKFDAFLLSAAGLNVNPVVSQAGRVQLPVDLTDAYPACPYPEAAARGHMKFSPQGDKLVVLSTSDCHEGESHGELFSFNATSGTVTYDFDLPVADTSAYYGASFSPNGNLLYASSGWYGRHLHQFDLSAYDSVSVANSKFIVYSDPDFIFNTGAPSALQIGPDGKIYNANNFLKINVINAPNQYGAGCDFEVNAIELPLDSCSINYSMFGLPNNDESYYLNSFTGMACSDVNSVDFMVEDSCAGSASRFFDASDFYPFTVNEWSWNFGDPASGIANFSQLQNPVHVFSTPGTYEVKLIVRPGLSNTCRMDSISKFVTINCTLGIQDQALVDWDVVVYPNPAKDVLHIQSPVTIQQVKIFDAQGALVLMEDTAFLSKGIYLNLAKGMYLVELKSDYGLKRTKIILDQHQ